MKLSRYITDIEIDDQKHMIYSTFSRMYYVYEKEEKEKVDIFLHDINKGVYTEHEINMFKALVNKKIVIQDELDEQKMLETLENAARYQESTYKIIIYATNACNFRCTYCEQPHITKRLTEETADRILKLLESQAKKNKKIEIDWFGGEPLLEYNKICSLLEKALEICNNNSCELLVTFTTNGYLLTEDKIRVLKQLNVKGMQITLDGSKKCHDKWRVLANGEGTFDIVLQNIIMVVKEGIAVTLRINVDKENIDDISEVIDAIPEKYRSQIGITICNIFQNEERLSTYSLYKQAMNKGYRYPQRWNQYTSCHACLKNAVVIDTGGDILLCSNTSNEESRMGFLDSKGRLCIERTADFYTLHTTTARNNPKCQKCIELPFCIGSCKYARLKDNSKCLGKSGDGLSLRERALLDYYSDLQNRTGRKQK